MKELVQRLSEGEHPVEASLIPLKKAYFASATSNLFS